MFRAIREQIDTIFREDPAAKSVIEIFTCYPGFHAILLHRLAHKLYRCNVPLVPRLISQLSRFFTQIEIHPGATIGRRFFIDAREIMLAMKRARGFGWDVIGVYHTHPNHPAVPSVFDRSAASPYWSYVIVSVREGSVAEVRSWVIDGDDGPFVEEQIAEH